MTIIGAHIVSHHRALVWCDSEMYTSTEAEPRERSEDEFEYRASVLRKLERPGPMVNPYCHRGQSEPQGHISKMSVNNLLFAVTVATGTGLTLRIAGGLLQVARSTAALVEDLEAELRKQDERSTVVLVAWSQRQSRFASFVFAHGRNYVPMLTTSVVLPAIDELTSLEYAEDVVSTARKQMVEIKREIPRAGKGMLTVAELTPEAITIRPMFDFGKDAAISAPAFSMISGA